MNSKKICPNCNKEEEIYVKYCRYCGNSFINETQDYNKEEKVIRNVKIMILLGIVILLMLTPPIMLAKYNIKFNDILTIITYLIAIGIIIYVGLKYKETRDMLKMLVTFVALVIGMFICIILFVLLISKFV